MPASRYRQPLPPPPAEASRSGALVVACAVVWLLVAPLTLPTAAGDGIPLVPIELHGALRENRQLAYVEVLNVSAERLELFINVASLSINESVTIVVPLPSAPTSVTGGNTTDTAFRSEREMDRLAKLHEKQTDGWNRLGRKSAESLLVFSVVECFGWMVPSLAYYTWTGSTSFYGGGDDEASYDFDGLSVDVRSVESHTSLEQLYAGLNLTPDASVNETLERYGDFNVAIINTTTQPPIAANDFYRIQNRAPRSLALLEDFVKENASVTVYKSVWSLRYSQMAHISKALLNETGYDNRREMDYWDFETYNLFWDLVAAIYGMSDAEGYLVSFELPLPQHEAYYPLGTSSAWAGSDEIEVIFDVPDKYRVDFNVAADEAFEDGRIYYIFDYSGEQPDNDLSGTIAEADWSDKVQKRRQQVSGTVWERAPVLGPILAFLTIAILWFIPALVVARKVGWDLTGRSTMHLFGLVCLSVIIGFLSPAIGVIFAAMFLKNRIWYVVRPEDKVAIKRLRHEEREIVKKLRREKDWYMFSLSPWRYKHKLNRRKLIMERPKIFKRKIMKEKPGFFETQQFLISCLFLVILCIILITSTFYFEMQNEISFETILDPAAIFFTLYLSVPTIIAIVIIIIELRRNFNIVDKSDDASP